MLIAGADHQLPVGAVDPALDGDLKRLALVEQSELGGEAAATRRDGAGQRRLVGLGRRDGGGSLGTAGCEGGIGNGAGRAASRQHQHRPAEAGGPAQPESPPQSPHPAP